MLPDSPPWQPESRIAREAIGPAGGLGQAIAAAASEHPFHGGVEAHAVARGDIQRFHASAGADHGADDFAAFLERYA